ncbi:MAG: inositol monophosphatase family protein [Anaerolineaceae bacterium]
MRKQHFPDTRYLDFLAKEAGEIITSNFQLGMKKEWKEDATPLTASDTQINELVIERFKHDYPHICVIGEEGSCQVDGAEYQVLCDPIDGTFPFCMGAPICAFCITVLKGDNPLSAVIYDPFMNRLWHANARGGAFLNNDPIRVSERNSVKGSMTCMVWWGGSGYNLHTVCEKIMNAGGKWMNPASIAYFGGLVASGEMEATIFPGPYGWETAAMSLIVEEAGGRATDLFGNPLRYGTDGKMQSCGHIISNGAVHDELMKLVAEAQNG